MTVFIYGPNDTLPKEYEVINTTSHSKTWSKGLSPFFLGPCELYSDYVSKNVENGWQYSKVYPQFVDENNNPNEKYFEWAKRGWTDTRANRYPMGKGKKPLYTYWNGEKLSYVEARKKIYIPMYAKAVIKTEAFKKLKELYDSSGVLHLWDFDGYNHIKLNKTLKEVVNDPTRKMGHAFVLAYLLKEIK